MLKAGFLSPTVGPYPQQATGERLCESSPFEPPAVAQGLRRRYLSRNILSVSLGHRTGRGLLYKCSQREITYPGSCLVCGLFRDRVEVCSGLVDLVVGVGQHGGGGHRLSLAGERFVGRVAEDVAEVRDRDGEFRESPSAEGT